MKYVKTFPFKTRRAIISNADVRPEAELLPLAWHDFWGTPLMHGGSHGSYRPLTVLTFRMDVWMHGSLHGAESKMHGVNAVLHALACWLVTHWTRRISAGCDETTWSTALLFASHPVHTEAVAGLVGRAELLAACLSLIAILVEMKGWTKSAVFSATAGMFSKEAGVMSLCVAASWHLTRDLSRWRRFFCLWGSSIFVCTNPRRYYTKRHPPPPPMPACKAPRIASAWRLLAAAILLTSLRMLIAGCRTPTFSSADNPAARHPSQLTRALTFMHLPVVNMWLLLMPHQLSFDWSMDSVPLVHHLDDLRNLGSLVLYLALIGATVYHCFLSGSGMQQIRHSRIVLAGLGVLVLSFLPATNLLAYVGFVIAERVLYFPSLGFCLLVGSGYARLLRLSRRKWPIRLIMFLVILTFCWKTIRRNAEWADEESLYRSGLTVNPAKACGNLGSILSSKGRVLEAEHFYRKALKYRPNMADVHYNLGVLMQAQNRIAEAMDCFQSAIEYRPSLAIAHLNLGLLLARSGRPRIASTLLCRCADLEDTTLKDPLAHSFARASCLTELGRLELHSDNNPHSALKYLNRAEGIQPAGFQSQIFQPVSLYNIMGETYQKMGDSAMAETWFRKAIELRPNHVPSYLVYGKMLALNRSRSAEAEQWFRRAEAIRPPVPTALRHYGEFLMKHRRYNEASAKFARAHQLEAYGLAETSVEDILDHGIKTRSCWMYKQPKPKTGPEVLQWFLLPPLLKLLFSDGYTYEKPS